MLCPSRTWSENPRLLLLSLTVVTLCGCGQPETPSASEDSVTAEEVMTRLISGYRDARTYQDNALVRLTYRRDGQNYEDKAPLNVCWQAPNRLHVRAYQVEVTCDGEQMMARIHDEATRDFDHQVVVRSAPESLSLDELWGKDEILSLAFRQGLAGYPLQLDLLLSKTPLAALMQENAKHSLMQPADIESHTCHRVKVATNDGPFVLWVDRRDFILRRIEYPAAAFAPEIAEDELVSDLQLRVECPQASFDQEPAAETFAFDLPATAKCVKQFIPPPRELPSDLFGQKTAPYRFKSLSGETVSNQSLGERIKVLVWFNNHPACQSTVQQLNQIHQQYKAQQDVAIRAICAESSSFTNEQIRALARSWHVELPLVRDPHAVGRDLFEVPWAPTLVVLDSQDVVQIYEVGANPNLVAELPQVLEQLLAGKDVAGMILDEHRREQTRYERALRRGKPEPPSDSPETTLVKSRSTPQVLQVRPLWTNTKIRKAGNLLTVRDRQDRDRFLVHEGWRTITELSSDGTILARHELDLPANAAVSQLRTAVDADARRYYVAWSIRGPQAHVFNEQWNRILGYPPKKTKHQGVQDALLSDLDGDGQLELQVGLWGMAGVHSVTLSGTKLWENQDISHVLSLMQTTPVDGRSSLWVSSASGAVTELDRHGRGKPINQHSGQLTHQLFSGTQPRDAPIPYCAISYGMEGRRLAIGLKTNGESQWRYNLPAGAFATHLRLVTSAPLLDDNSTDWLIAAADGSLHIISQNGHLTDHFQTGKSITGVAAGRQASVAILVVSSQSEVIAWQLSPPATASAK